MQLYPASSPLQQFAPCSLLNRTLWIKRDDLLHPSISGNKFRKLKFALMALKETQAQNLQKVTLTTMGGPWSNHLHALAHAGAIEGWPTRGLVRGTENIHTAMLDDCRSLGMEIQFVSREDYRTLREVSGAWRRHVPGADDNSVWFPEGGSTPDALRGVAEIIEELPFIPEIMMVACGTGATMAGLLAGLGGRGHVIGIAVLKNADYLHKEIAILLQQSGHPSYTNYDLITDAHHGGYGKAPPELRQFCRDFSIEMGVPIEPVYTGKLFYALKKMIDASAFRKEERIVVVHTGGLQGARGFIG
ncbi:1-aminocyclopropane-1-carboxylate deaminase/D-cysteine desulfhydrase [Glaciimonas immobilis]|uniref:1-aminocyclopropane-1-carboxylate deaminase n=1 Tax=Glaciimonas immobilis TaxID=728004 RepID=A0A840S044_9BURK|nr:pyridoxal-phosphate dependent enzyme [Glaciimonas immobilis]KAF3998343.1 pyridoxal-phosphate dependent enzyme [Glaciimonas immobilis]MBB5201969.1 1-aminocyclopropane-1-carboxylate deaminase [Glaciimonas immobilis]